MCNQNEWIVREAFLAYDRGDVARMMDFVDPDLEWTYLDPGLDDPQPQTCRGRGELEKALRRQADRGLRAELEQVVAAGEKVMLVMRTPGVDRYTGTGRPTTGPTMSSPSGTERSSGCTPAATAARRGRSPESARQPGG